jgi:hypothetical protein
MHFIETEALLPCTQKPATGQYLELYESNPRPFGFILMLSSSLRLDLQSLLPFKFPDHIFACISHLSSACFIPCPLLLDSYVCVFTLALVTVSMNVQYLKHGKRQKNTNVALTNLHQGSPRPWGQQLGLKVRD